MATSNPVDSRAKCARQVSAAMGLLLSIAVMSASAGRASASEPIPVQPCDQLAMHPSDPDKILPGIERADIDFDQAITACRAAVMAYPEEARFRYQLGRVLYYAGGPTDAALVTLYAAADRGYRQAIFVIGFIFSDGKQVPRDMCRAGHLWRRSVALDHPWSKFYLAYHALKGDFGSCSFAVSPSEIDRYVAEFRALDVGPDGIDRQRDLVQLYESRKR